MPTLLGARRRSSLVSSARRLAVALVRAGRALAPGGAPAHGARAAPAGPGDLAALRADLGQALRHVAVVRYDAFGDMGGRLCFSAAVVDDRGDGLVFSSIHARGESRTYAKGVVGGTSDATLTPEEQQALAAARTGPEGLTRGRPDRTHRTYGYLGPEGTFTQMALDAWAPGRGRRAHRPAARSTRRSPPCAPATSTARWCRSRTPSRAASAPPSTPSPAATRSSSTGEVLVPITFVLAARPGTALADVRAVGTHSPRVGPGPRLDGRPTCPDAAYVPTLSTAAAAADGPRGRDAAAYQAAVCAPVAAANHGLEVLADGHRRQRGGGDPVRARRPAGRRCPSATGADKTTLVLFQRDDHAGGLLELLEQFAARGINMTRLESRPTKESMGCYCFSIDIEGHVLDERVGEALIGLKRVCAEVRFLGSYPAARRHGSAGQPAHHGPVLRRRAGLAAGAARPARGLRECAGSHTEMPART